MIGIVEDEGGQVAPVGQQTGVIQHDVQGCAVAGERGVGEVAGETAEVGEAGTARDGLGPDGAGSSAQHREDAEREPGRLSRRSHGELLSPCETAGTGRSVVPRLTAPRGLSKRSRLDSLSETGVFGQGQLSQVLLRGPLETFRDSVRLTSLPNPERNAGFMHTFPASILLTSLLAVAPIHSAPIR